MDDILQEVEDGSASQSRSNFHHNKMESGFTTKQNSLIIEIEKEAEHLKETPSLHLKNKASLNLRPSNDVTARIDLFNNPT